MSRLKATIENLAVRIAAAHSGKVYPADLLPWLPISLEMAEEHLRDMTDGQVVHETQLNDLLVFEFTEFSDDPPQPIDISDLFASLSDNSGHPMWPADDDRLKEELMQLAEEIGWPAEAVKHHEILFITATTRGPISVARVSGQSRLTLSQLQDELKRLAARRYIKAVIDEKRGLLTFEFPPLDYNRDAFQRNDGFVRRHPSSLKDEIQMRLTRLLVCVIGILLVCIVLAFFRVPFPVLIMGALTGSLVAAIGIMTHKTRIAPEQL